MVQKFDELNISQSDKENRIECFNAASKNLMDLFEEYEDKAIDDKQLLSKVRDILITIGISAGLYFLDVGNELEDAISTESDEGTIRECIDAIAKSIAIATLNHEEEYYLSKDRADNIAFIETNRLYNTANHYVAKKEGYAFHKWVSTLDKYTRPNHYAINGQWKPIDIPFEVNGYLMMFPMDISLGAPIEETINCRCVETFFQKNTHVV